MVNIVEQEANSFIVLQEFFNEITRSPSEQDGRRGEKVFSVHSLPAQSSSNKMMRQNSLDASPLQFQL